MPLSRIAVRRPVATTMVFVALVVLGLVSWRQLPVQLLPDFTVPTIGVFVSKPGASGTENLDELTKPVESIIAELPRVRHVRSWTGSWGTWIRTDFEFGTDIRFAAIDLQERLNAFQQGLPDRRTAIEVYPFSTESFKNFLMEVSLEGSEDQELLQDLVRERIESQLETVTGVARVEIGGLTTEAAEVMIDPARLAGHGLEFGQVLQRVQAAASDDEFLGRLDVPGETHFVRMDSRVRTIDELRRLVVDGKGVVQLQDVADVDEGDALDGWIYRSNGKNAVGLQIEREEGENLIRVAGLVRERVAEINATLPEGTELVVETDIAEIVEEVIGQVQKLALQGAALALLVPLIFFRSWRIAGIIFISVPICIVAVFNLFYATGMSINVFSVIGLALGVGILVDNSIVVVENCFRLYFQRHMGALRAAELGGGEVGRALLASTLTTCVPFLALFFVEGEFRLFIKEPALALTFPLMLSLLVALSLSAMLTSKALQSVVRHKGARGDREFETAARRLNPPRSRMRELYRWMLKSAIRHRGRVLAIIAILLAFTFLEACEAVRQSTTSRDESQDFMRVYLVMPPGTKTSETSLTAEAVEDRLAEHGDIERFAVWFQGENANFDIKVKKSSERPSGRTLGEIRASIVDFVGQVPNGELTLERPNRPSERETAPAGDLGQLILSGLDLETIDEYAARLTTAIEVLPDIAVARAVEDDRQPEYFATIDREKTKLFGVSAQTLGQYVNATRSSGAISSLVLRDGEKRTDVTISVANSEAETLATLRDLPVYTETGSVVPFGDLSSFRTHLTPSDLRREDRQSSLLVEYHWIPGADQNALQERILEIVRALPNPAGVVAEFGGKQAELDQRDTDFRFALLVGVLLIYVVMAAAFESFWVPFTIIVTNPLMIIGIVCALAITGLPFEELAAFGVLLLNGLAVNNGIVLMDAAMYYRRERNYRSLRAIFQAADQRLRPIVMTFLTTTLGLLPMALVGDAESQWRPVAVTVVGGLTSATFLTLVVLPCFYLIGEDIVRWANPMWLGFLRFVFRIVETVGNAASRGVAAVVCFWKWRPLRWPRSVFRAIRFMVVLVLLRIPGAVLKTAWRVARTIVRSIGSVAGDLRFVAKSLRRGVPPPRTEALPAPVRRPHATLGGAPPVDIRNLRVIFPLRRMPNPLRLLPGRGIPIGHRPKTGLEALKGVTLAIEPGLFGLLGPNGAGKTTLLRCIAGLESPDRGTVRLFGSAWREAGESLAPLIGYLPQTHGHYPWMTLYEYLDYFAILTARTQMRARQSGETGPRFAPEVVDLSDPVRRCDAVMLAAESVNLSDRLGDRIGEFSGGMRQRAGIARVLVQSPPVVIVDEPTAGLDPIERVRVRLLLGELARTRCVIFSTHIVDDLEESCNAVGILAGGRLLYSGSPDRLRSEWNGRVWDVPMNESDPESVRRDLLAGGARVLFRYARERGEGWRCIAPSAPAGGARHVAVTLEDAFLGVLGADRAAMERRAAHV